MDDSAATRDRSPHTENIEEKLNFDQLNDEQLKAIADAWDQAKNTDTPMASLRGAMTDSGLFDFVDKYNTNNIELRDIATRARASSQERQTSKRKTELDAIVSAANGKTTYADKRTALSDLLGFRNVYEMNNLELDRFIEDARRELASMESPDAEVSEPSDPDEAHGTPTSETEHTTSDESSEDVDSPADPIDEPDQADETAPASEPEQPQPDQPSELKLSFVDQSKDAEAAARDAAEARWRAELQQGGRFKRFLRNIWKGENSVLGGVYFQRYKREAMAQIQRDNDILSHESSDIDARQRAQMATIERFQSEYDESIHDEAGESRQELATDSAFGLAMKDLLRRYASGEISDPEALHEERGRILEQLNQSGSGELIGEGKVRIDNLLAIAEQVKAMVQHGEGLEAILSGMKIYSGEARSNVRSEAHLTKIDRTVERIQNSSLRGILSPETIGLVAAVGLGVTRAGRGSLIAAAGVTMIPGVLTGGLAAVRENTRVKQERALHSREMAQGKSYEVDSTRRDQIEATRYNTVNAHLLTTELDGLLRSDGDPSAEDVQRAYELIATIEARIKISDSRNIDLVSYSDVTSIERERLDLDIARAAAKVRLRSHLDKLPDDFRSQFSIDGDAEVDSALGSYIDTLASFDNDISEKDKAFRKLKRRRVAKAAAAGAVTGAAAGVVLQESLAYALPNYDGLVEGITNPDNISEDGTQTVLERLVNGQPGGVETTQGIAPSSTYTSHDIGSHPSALEIPDNYTLVDNPDGSVSIKDPSGELVASNIVFDDSGNLTAASETNLFQNDVIVIDSGATIDREVTKNVAMPVEEYIESHAENTENVKRQFWFDNDTPAPKFDKNELGLSYGGEGNNGIGEGGSIVMDVSGMTSDGSYHGPESTNWTEDAQEGSLKLAISATRDTQTNVFMFDVQPNGTVEIPPDHPAAQLFSNEQGQIEFNGAYAEVAEVRGQSGETTSIVPLATVVGDEAAREINTPVTTVSQEYVPHLKFIPPAAETVVETPAKSVEGFGAPGTVLRSPLEVARRRDRRPYGYGYRYNRRYGAELSEEEKRMAKDRSPRIEADPQARLDTAAELGWYRDHIRSSAGADYADEIERAIESSPELANIPPETEAVVTIPVAAASESDNIYKTLSLYAKQGEAAKQATILLHVNWFDSAGNDPDKSAKIQKTRAEIERAKRDFPQLHIANFETVWSSEKQQRGEYGNGMIGHVTQRLYDTAMMSVERAMREGRMPNKDVLLLRNDADAQGMDAQYLERMIRLFDRNKDKDVFTGAVRWETEKHKDMPGLAFVTNFREIMHVLSNRKGFESWTPTIGINMGARMSTLAAVGGIGHDQGDTGAGTDDLAVAARIGAAREPVWGATYGTSYSRAGADTYGDNSSSGGISQYVPGANIDTKVDRIEAEYVSGRPITEAWGGFDEGGYRERSAGLRGKRMNERGRRQSRDMLKRVELSMSAMISEWFHDPAHVATGLSYLMPSAYQGKPTYQIVQRGNRTEFKFTDQGRRWASKNIARDPERVRHELYRKIGPFNRSQSPRFVQ